MNTKMVFGLVVMLMLTACAQPGLLEVEVVSAAGATIVQDDAMDDLEPIVSAMLTGSAAERTALIQYLKAECVEPVALGGPPACRNDERPGDLVEAFPVGGGEGSFVRSDEIEGVLSFTVDGLYAVYLTQASAVTEPYWPQGEYALLFARTQNGIQMPIIVLTRSGRIVRIDFKFDQHPAEILASVSLSNIIRQPDPSLVAALPPTAVPPTPVPYRLDLTVYGAPLEWPFYTSADNSYQLQVEPRWSVETKGQEVIFTAPESAAFSQTLVITVDARNMADIEAAYKSDSDSVKRSAVYFLSGLEGVAFLDADGHLDLFTFDAGIVYHLSSDYGEDMEVLSAISTFSVMP